MSSPLWSILNAYDPDRPLELASSLPAAWYTNPDLANLERRVVFANTWQYVGPVAWVEQPGAYMTALIADEPVAVVRSEDGHLRALSNVCRHRACPVLDQERGHATTLRCPYHGWTYATDGRLRGAPELDAARDFARADHGLPQLPLAVWGPWVFVRVGTGDDVSSGGPLANQPPAHHQAPAAVWPGLVEHFATNGLADAVSRLVPARRVVYHVACNWKVYVDNYLDGGYHVARVHPGLHSVLDYAGYRTYLALDWNVQISPMRPASSTTGAVRTGSTAYYYWLWPNFTVNCYSGVMDTNFIVPAGPHATRVVFDYWFSPDADPDFVENSIRIAGEIQDEDQRICEAVQTGLASRHWPPGRYSPRRENGQHQFHSLLARSLRGALASSQPHL